MNADKLVGGQHRRTEVLGAARRRFKDVVPEGRLAEAAGQVSVAPSVAAVILVSRRKPWVQPALDRPLDRIVCQSCRITSTARTTK